MGKANAPYDPAFGRILRRARLRLDKTQAEIAALVRITDASYGRIERGQVLSSLRTFAALRRVLGFDANELVMAMDQRSVHICHRGEAHTACRLAQDISGPYKVFASELGQARRRHRLTQETLAKSVQCSPRFYMRIETGRALPSVLLFARLHHRLAFDANRLLDALDETPSPTPRYYRLGVFIAASRHRAGQTITATARAAGCSVQDYERIEAGTRRPTLSELTGLHGLLEFSGNAALRRLRQCEDDAEQSGVSAPGYAANPHFADAVKRVWGELAGIVGNG